MSGEDLQICPGRHHAPSHSPLKCKLNSQTSSVQILLSKNKVQQNTSLVTHLHDDWNKHKHSDTAGAGAGVGVGGAAGAAVGAGAASSAPTLHPIVCSDYKTYQASVAAIRAGSCDNLRIWPPPVPYTARIHAPRPPASPHLGMDYTGKSFGYRLHIFSCGKQLNNLSVLSSFKVKILYQTEYLFIKV